MVHDKLVVDSNFARYPFMRIVFRNVCFSNGKSAGFFGHTTMTDEDGSGQ